MIEQGVIRMRVLVVDDEKMIADNIKRHLKREGYAIDVCYDGVEALQYSEQTEYDVIVLDIMLPKLDGLSVLQTLKRHRNPAKVLLLSAKSTVSDRVKGLDYGADDYMIKPFSLEELSARIRALTRRQNDDVSDSKLQIRDLILDTNAKIAIINDKKVSLTAKEYAVLEYLMLNKGVVISRDRLLEHIWSYDYDGASNIIDVYIRTLRKKLGNGNEYIETLRGIGYVIR